MGKLNKSHSSMSIVLIGSFNPLIYHPEWFKSNNILPPEDVDAVLNSQEPNLVVSPGLTLFRTSNIEINVTPERFMIKARKQPFVFIKDVLQKSFEKLGSTPVKQMGINDHYHIKFDSEKELQDFADIIVPKVRWNSLLGDEVKGTNRVSGLTKIQMRKTTDFGAINYTLEPSPVVKPGVYISNNHHYNLEEESQFAEDAMEILEQNFTTTVEKTDCITREIIFGDPNE